MQAWKNLDTAGYQIFPAVRALSISTYDWGFSPFRQGVISISGSWEELRQANGSKPSTWNSDQWAVSSAFKSDDNDTAVDLGWILDTPACEEKAWPQDLAGPLLPDEFDEHLLNSTLRVDVSRESQGPPACWIVVEQAGHSRSRWTNSSLLKLYYGLTTAILVSLTAVIMALFSRLFRSEPESQQGIERGTPWAPRLYNQNPVPKPQRPTERSFLRKRRQPPSPRPEPVVVAPTMHRTVSSLPDEIRYCSELLRHMYRLDRSIRSAEMVQDPGIREVVAREKNQANRIWTEIRAMAEEWATMPGVNWTANERDYMVQIHDWIETQPDVRYPF